MCYRCTICTNLQAPGKSRKIHTVYRDRKQIDVNVSGGEVVKTVKISSEIAREELVCDTCFALLSAGMPYALVHRNRNPKPLQPEPVAVSEPDPKPYEPPIYRPVVLGSKANVRRGL